MNGEAGSNQVLQYLALLDCEILIRMGKQNEPRVLTLLKDHSTAWSAHHFIRYVLV